MRFFVTGVNGQLGHDVMNELYKRGHEGIGSDLKTAYSGVADGSAVTTLPYVSLDITDKYVLVEDEVICVRYERGRQPVMPYDSDYILMKGLQGIECRHMEAVAIQLHGIVKTLSVAAGRKQRLRLLCI